MSALQITDLHKSFASQRVLRGLDLEVPAGSLTAILGPSGSGKTTLLRLLAGFDRPDAGTIKIDGRTVDATDRHVHPEQRKIGYVPQEGGLFPHLNVEANITFGLPRAARRKGASDLLEMVGLAGLERRYPHELSGGQQQRVALARALAIKPEIVLLDEPFASLDAHQRVSVGEDVRRILRESGTTTLMVTHDQDEALSLADLLAVLRDGRIAQYATPEDLYARPVDHELARFVGEANILEGILEGALVQTPLGRLPAHWQGEAPASGSRVSVLIRPEQIELNRMESGEGLRGEIAQTGYHGHDAVVHVELDEGQSAESVIVRTLGDTTPPAGSQVGLSARGSVLVWPAQAGNGHGASGPAADGTG